MRKFYFTSTIIILFFTSPIHAQVKLPKDLDAYIENVRKTFEVPGLAVAIVKDDKVLFAKGFGEKLLGSGEPVDAHTLFGIASNTKIFTATALALLVEEGKLAWDAPVINYLPSFQLSNPLVTHEITVRDLLVHRSGLSLGAGDLLWWPPSTYTRKEITRQLKYIPLSTSFRSAYAYDNVLYLVAGEVIEAVSGLTWEDFITSRIFKPLGMNESKVHFTMPSKQSNVATPHARMGNQVKAIAPMISDNTNPAGGINANVTDMARWMMLQMDSGRINNKERLFKPGSTIELWSIVTPFPIRSVSKELAPLQSNFSGYALGLNARDFRGKKLLIHSGGLPGYVSRVAMIPELKLGVVVLTNQESSSAFDAINYHILDHFLGAPSFDWLVAYKKVEQDRNARVAEAETLTSKARNEKSKPSLPLANYAGKYEDAWYGGITLSYPKETLEIQFDHSPSLKGKLEHWQYDTFVVRWYDRELRADAFITFALNPDGTIDQAKMKPASPSVDFSYDFQDLTLKKK